MFLMHRKISIIAVFLFFLVACGEKKIASEIYLIPEGYVGKIYVVYGVKSGLKPEYEEGARLFEMSDTGIIHTQFPQNYGLGFPGMIRFYSVTKDGERTEITDTYGSRVEDTSENRNDKRFYIMGGGFGEFGFTEETTGRGCKYKDQSFYVGTLKDRLESVGDFRIEEYYLKHGYPCP